MHPYLNNKVNAWLHEKAEPNHTKANQGGGIGYTKAKEKFMQDRDNEAEIRNKPWADMTQEEREEERLQWNLEQEARLGL